MLFPRARFGKAAVAVALALASFLLIPLSVRAQLTAKVVGGKDSFSGDYLWMAALVRNDYTTLTDGQFGGAVLIDSNWVVTAAHCVDNLDLEDFIIAIGDENLEGSPRLIRPKLILVHPASYNRVSRGGDIALVQLSEPVDDIEPVSLRRRSDVGPLPGEGRVLGWGRTSFDPDAPDANPSILQAADVPILRLDDPVLVENGYSDRLLPEFIATGDVVHKVGAYKGDSGGPLLVSRSDDGAWTLAGIDSWGASGDLGALSMYTDVAFYEEWIKAAIDASLWSPPEGDVLQFEGGVFGGENGETIPGVRIWPFEGGSQRTVEFSTDLWRWSASQLNLANLDGIRLDDDGSLLLSPDEWHYGERSVFARGKETNATAVRSGPFPMLPFQLLEGRGMYDGGSFYQTQNVFRLLGYEVGRSYAVSFDSPSRSSLFTLYARGSDDALKKVRAEWAGYGYNRFHFNPEEGVEYWLVVDFGYEFHMYSREDDRISIGSDLWYEGVLDTSDSVYRYEGIYVDAYTSSSYFSGDIAIELESVFDAEMGVYDVDSGERIAYYDQGAENDMETLIMYGDDLRGNDFRIFNFDNSILGSYRFRITESSEGESVSVGTDEQRAVTRADRSLESEGRTIYFDQIKIDDTGMYLTVTVLVGGFADFKPWVAVYDLTTKDYVETSSGRRSSIAFQPNENNEYALIVLASDGRLNHNYKLKISGELNEALSDPSSSDSGEIGFSNPALDQELPYLLEDLAKAIESH